MNCANHPEAPAIGYCRECGKPLCEACRREAGGTLYCEEHSPVLASPPAPPPTPSPYTAPEPTPYSAPEATPYTAAQPHPTISDSGASPGLAFLLGFIPGVGAIYNGQYVKGLIHVVIMGLLISIVSNEDMSGNLEPLFGMMIGVWVFYMAFEAYHTAKRRQLGQPVDEFSSIVPRHGQHSKFPLAPTVLIAVGLIFLLHNLDILRIGQIIRYWPIALIGLGVYMLYERVAGSSEPSGHHTQPPGGHQ
jgi:Domain of unknown function (DUF5668)/B-box zinc finger